MAVTGRGPALQLQKALSLRHSRPASTVSDFGFGIKIFLELARVSGVTPDTCIRDVARAMRACCDEAALAHVLAGLSREARALRQG